MHRLGPTMSMHLIVGNILVPSKYNNHCFVHKLLHIFITVKNCVEFRVNALLQNREGACRHHISCTITFKDQYLFLCTNVCLRSSQFCAEWGFHKSVFFFKKWHEIKTPYWWWKIFSSKSENFLFSFIILSMERESLRCNKYCDNWYIRWEFPVFKVIEIRSVQL